MDEVYNGLEHHGIAQESEGALVAFHPEHARYKKQPFIVRKSDGASNYATTDLATILYRIREWKWRDDWLVLTLKERWLRPRPMNSWILPDTGQSDSLGHDYSDKLDIVFTDMLRVRRWN